MLGPRAQTVALPVCLTAALLLASGCALTIDEMRRQPTAMEATFKDGAERVTGCLTRYLEAASFGVGEGGLRVPARFIDGVGTIPVGLLADQYAATFWLIEVRSSSTGAEASAWSQGSILPPPSRSRFADLTAEATRACGGAVTIDKIERMGPGPARS